MQTLPVLILAGGINSRFFPLNSSSHKGGVTLHGETLLTRTLRNLKQNGFEKIVIAISSKEHESGGIKHEVDAVNKDLQLEIQLALQPEAKGMGDAVLIALETLNQPDVQSVAVLSPYHVSGGDLLSQMQPLGDLVLCTSPTTTPERYGIASFSADGKMTGIVEKPAVGTEPSKEKVISLYVLSKQFIQTLKQAASEEYSFETALDQCLKQTPAPVLHLQQEIVTLKYAWNLFDFQRAFFQQMKSHRDATAKIAETAVIDESFGAVSIEAGAVIGHSARIVGPCYIGKNSKVGDFCLVRESSLEDEVVIGAHSEISRSIFLSASSIHRGYVGDSIIGAETSLAAGFITANKRFDRKSVPISVKEKSVDSGRRGFGTIIGEKTRIGTNVSTMPGKLIGSNCTIFPSQTIYHNVPDRTIFPAVENKSERT